MRRATVTAISLLVITLTVCAQARSETEWEKFREWEKNKTQKTSKTAKKKPMPAICRNIEKHHPDKQELMEYLCGLIPLARVYTEKGHYCRTVERSLAEEARDIAKLEKPWNTNIADYWELEAIHKKIAFCRQAFRMRLMFEWLKRNK